MATHFALFAITMTLLITVAVGEIRSTQIRSDSRSTIPFDEFGYTHVGRLNLTVTDISFSAQKTPLSQLGFFLCTLDAWVRVLEQLQEGEIQCPLESNLIKKGLHFRPITTVGA